MMVGIGYKYLDIVCDDFFLLFGKFKRVRF